MSQKKKSAHFVSGLAVGTAIAGLTTFLYKTKKGKKLRKEFEPHLENAKGFLGEQIKDIKTKAKKLEAALEDQTKETVKKTKTVKRQLKKTTDQAKKKVFLKRGQPLAK